MTLTTGPPRARTRGWPSGRRRSTRRLRQRLDADVPVVDDTVGIMRLQRDRPALWPDRASRTFSAAVPVGRLCPRHRLLLVHLHRDRLILHDDMDGEPLVVFHR